MLEIINEVIYLVLILYLFYFNDLEDWSDIPKYIYIGLIFFNFILIFIISLVSLILAIKKRNFMKNKVEVKGNISFMTEKSIKNSFKDSKSFSVDKDVTRITKEPIYYESKEEFKKDKYINSDVLKDNSEMSIEARKTFVKPFNPLTMREAYTSSTKIYSLDETHDSPTKWKESIGLTVRQTQEKEEDIPMKKIKVPKLGIDFKSDKKTDFEEYDSEAKKYVNKFRKIGSRIKWMQDFMNRKSNEDSTKGINKIYER
mmetsp:Transcript_23590/g.20951  ORF Transcript_23590/g.20951 Transcript_23590/m.20951 type:complete len:257 (+) Transcript_23590:399-1169(+)